MTTPESSDKYVNKIKLAFAWWPVYVGGCYERRYQNDFFIWFRHYLTVSGPKIQTGRYILLPYE
jgi:hypothetical protein